MSKEQTTIDDASFEQVSLDEMENVAGQDVYIPDPNEDVPEFSLSDIDGEYSETETVVVTIHGKKQRIEVLIVDDFHRIMMHDFGDEESRALIEELNEIQMSNLPEMEIQKEMQAFLNGLDESERALISKHERDVTENTLINAIVSPRIIANEDDRQTPKDILIEKLDKRTRKQFMKAYHLVNNSNKGVLEVRFQKPDRNRTDPNKSDNEVLPGKK